MRSALNKVIYIFVIFLIPVFFSQAESKDFSKFEATCKEIGFTPKTEAFGECVLELVERAQGKNTSAATDSDSQTCINYGFKPNTQPFAECKFKLDMAKQESARVQEHYAREKEAYDERIAAIEKERERQRGLRQMEFGLRLMGGQSPVDAFTSIGTGRPIAPSMPDPITQTITTPSGRVIHCTTMGSMTNCN